MPMVAVAIALRSLAAVPAPPAAPPPAAPVLCEPGRGAVWTAGRAGYDGGLPGFRLDGAIGSAELKPGTNAPPEVFRLALRTTPGHAPHLDQFAVTAGETRIACEPFNAAAMVHDTVAREHFGFEVEGDAVIVTFKPKACALLRGRVHVSWVDWYRN